MPQLFNKIKIGSTKRSTIDLSHHQVTTSDFGYIIPICVREMVPNDDFVVKPNIFCRLAPLAVPTYGRVKAKIFHFFVPNRILYPDWDSFIGSDASNNTTPPYSTVADLRSLLQSDPQFYNGTGTPTGYRGQFGRLMSNFGINPYYITRNGGLDVSDRINMLPFLAYYRIWIDYFMDSSLNDHPTEVRWFNNLIASGGHLSAANLPSLLTTKNICFSKDYYTTAKVNPQDGSASKVGVDVSFDLNPSFRQGASGIGIAVKESSGKIYTSGHEAEGTKYIGEFTIEALRAANSLQRYKERNNYVGSKLINKILAHFGIAPTPERLDMAEYLGGQEMPIQIGDVTSSAFHPSGSPQTFGLGDMAGKGIGASRGDSVRYHATEHGIFMTVMALLPSVGYYQALPYAWTRGVYGDPFDYYHSEFENLGYEFVLNKEVYVPTVDDPAYSNYNPDGIFGYVPRYASYKFHNDILAGDFVGRLVAGGSFNAQMDSWHLFRKFQFDNSSPLALNSNFVECDNRSNDFDRIFQNTSTDLDHFYFNIDMDVKATRPMVGFAEPVLGTVNEEDGNAVNIT